MKQLTENLREAFREILVENQWMDAQTRAAALEKLQQIYFLVAYPEFVLNDATLDNFYQEVFFGYNLQNSSSTSILL